MQKITVPKGTTITTSIENDMLVFEFECKPKKSKRSKLTENK